VGARKPDREGWEDNIEADDERKLQTTRKRSIVMPRRALYFDFKRSASHPY
jgi:hypothetical protein